MVEYKVEYLLGCEIEKKLNILTSQGWNMIIIHPIEPRLSDLQFGTLQYYFTLLGKECKGDELETQPKKECSKKGQCKGH